MNQLSQLAKSKQGKELLDKAKTLANDPKTREKIDGARGKLNEHVETAKQKMAEKKAKDGEPGTATPTRGADPTPDAPLYGEPNAPTQPGAAAGPGPADTPLYGEDGPRAA